LLLVSELAWWLLMLNSFINEVFELKIELLEATRGMLLVVVVVVAVFGVGGGREDCEETAVLVSEVSVGVVSGAVVVVVVSTLVCCWRVSGCFSFFFGDFSDSKLL